jgi:probable blue pigment (indigoidine) exporter
MIEEFRFYNRRGAATFSPRNAESKEIQHMDRRDWLMTALAPALWGTMPAVATEMFPPGHPLFVATARSLGAGVIILVVFRQLPPITWRWRLLILGTVNIALVFALFFISAARTTGGMIAILMALSPFWAQLLAQPLLGERVRAERLLLITFGAAGVAFVVRAAPIGFDPAGILAGLGASVCMGCGIVLIKKWGRPASLLVFAGWQLLIGGILLGVLTLATETLPTVLTTTNLLALFYLVLASTILAFFLWFRGIERIGAQRTSMLLLLVPVVSFAVDMMFLRKQLTPMQGLGALMVLGCLFADALVASRRTADAKSLTATAAPSATS